MKNLLKLERRGILKGGHGSDWRKLSARIDKKMIILGRVGLLYFQVWAWTNPTRTLTGWLTGWCSSPLLFFLFSSLSFFLSFLSFSINKTHNTWETKISFFPSFFQKFSVHTNQNKDERHPQTEKSSKNLIWTLKGRKRRKHSRVTIHDHEEAKRRESCLELEWFGGEAERRGETETMYKHWAESVRMPWT